MITFIAIDPVRSLWRVYDRAVAAGDIEAAERILGDINELCGLPREWRSLSERRAEKKREAAE